MGNKDILYDLIDTALADMDQGIVRPIEEALAEIDAERKKEEIEREKEKEKLERKLEKEEKEI